nr:MAG TPA: hypothetical protein [Caudoviricetes sp.]
MSTCCFPAWKLKFFAKQQSVRSKHGPFGRFPSLSNDDAIITSYPHRRKLSTSKTPSSTFSMNKTCWAQAHFTLHCVMIVPS